jgi:hypothetical protein
MVKTGFVPDIQTPFFSLFPKEYAAKFRKTGDKNNAAKASCYYIAKMIESL